MNRRPLSVLALLVALLCPAALRAQVRQPYPLTDSLVFTVPVTTASRVGPHLVLNGDFGVSRRDTTGSTTGRWALDIRTRTPLSGRTFHQVVGPDSAGKTASVAAPGDGLIAYRKGALVRLSSDATVQDRWEIRADGGMVGMQLYGDTLFLYGGFTRLGGVERRGVAAVRMSTREVLPFAVSLFRPYLEPATVTDMTVRGNRVFVYGDNGVVNGSASSGVIALDRATGALLPWQAAGGAVRASVFHPSGIVACKISTASSCGRYSYEDGSVLKSFSESPGSIFVTNNSGWVGSYFGGANSREGLAFYDINNNIINYFRGSEISAYFALGNKYSKYWIFRYNDINIYVGRDRNDLYTMAPADVDTSSARRFAYFGGLPQQFSVLGHQVYASTDPAYVLPIDRATGHRSQLLVNTEQNRLDSLAWYSVCGNIIAASIRQDAAYYSGYFQKGSSTRCSGPYYRIARISAATGAVDPAFQPTLGTTGTSLVVRGMQAVPNGVLIYGNGDFYQPDVTLPRQGALALYTPTGQLAPPVFGVRNTNNNRPSVSTIKLLGDSLVAVGGVFAVAGGATRNGFAVLRLSNGTATAMPSPAWSSAFVVLGMEIQRSTAYVSGTATAGGTAQLWQIPLGGGPGTEVVCAGVGFRGLLGQIDAPSAGRLLVRTSMASLVALDPVTCEVTPFVNANGTVFNETLTSVVVEGATVWAFGQRVYRFSNPFPVSNGESERPLGDLAAPGVRVWPNPARTSSVQVAGGAVTMEREARAFDVLGREVWRAPLGVGEASAVWSVASLSSGVYVVQVVEASSGRVVGSTRLVRAR